MYNYHNMNTIILRKIKKMLTIKMMVCDIESVVYLILTLN